MSVENKILFTGQLSRLNNEAKHLIKNGVTLKIHASLSHPDPPPFVIFDKPYRVLFLGSDVDPFWFSSYTIYAENKEILTLYFNTWNFDYPQGL